jgi:phosphoribosylformimino-5-aminoimidazole carboxamide ribotide isomerase
VSAFVVVPAIDLRGGRVVRLKEGRPEDETRYSSDPAAVAREFEAQGAERIHVVDLDGAIDGRPQPDVVAAVIDAVQIPIEVGGGIRSVEDASRYLARGADRVIFGTAALENPTAVAEAVSRFGAAVAVALDARGGKVAVRGWQKVSSEDAVEVARRIAGWGVARIQYTDVSRDGMLVGPNVEATAEVARAAGVRVTAAGGVSTLSDLTRLAGRLVDGIDEAIVGKALYERRFTLAEALAAVAGEAADAR